MKKSVLTGAVAHLLAYPHIVLAVVVFTIGLVRNPGPTLYATAIIIAVLLGVRIAVPRLYRLVASAAHLWAKTVLKTWRLWDDRRAIRDSEKNMRATVISETQQLSDLGKEET